MAAMRSNSMFDWRGRRAAAGFSFIGIGVNAYRKGTFFFPVRQDGEGIKNPDRPCRDSRDMWKPGQCFAGCAGQ